MATRMMTTIMTRKNNIGGSRKPFCSLLLSFSKIRQQQQQQQRNFVSKTIRQQQRRQQQTTLRKKHNTSSLSSTSLLPYSSLSSSPIPSSLSPSLLLHKNQQQLLDGITQQQQRNSSTSTSSSDSNGDMKDEYGEMTDCGHTYVHDDAFVLESGYAFPKGSLRLRYQTYGELNETRDNVLVVCHALTGNASLHSWWGDLLGPNKAFDTEQYFVVCCNVLGSCYGSTNPTSYINNGNTSTEEQEEQQQYGLDFPDVSIQDTVRIQFLLLQKELNIRSIKCVIGGSFGGMQALEYAVQGGSSPTYGEFFSSDSDDDKTTPVPMVRSAIPIGCGAYHKAWQIAISEVQRQAVYSDPNWSLHDKPFEATKGLAVAREMGMISYRTALGYHNKFGRGVMLPDKQTQPQQLKEHEQYYGSNAPWKVKSYLKYQGIKFLDRFDPITYVKLTEQMDSHDITRNRCMPSDDDADYCDVNRNPTPECLRRVLGEISIPVRVLGIDSDILYPLWEQEQLVDGLPNGELKIIHSDDGHDGFLLEQDQVAKYITEFLEDIE